MRRKRLTFDAAWRDNRVQGLLRAVANENCYRFTDKDERLEWRLRSVLNAIKTFDRSKSEFRTHLWNKARWEWKQMQREKASPLPKRRIPKTHVDSRPRLRELKAAVDELLAMVERLEAEILRERYFDEHSYAEIGEPRGWNERQTKYRVDQALKRLRRICRRMGLRPEDYF